MILSSHLSHGQPRPPYFDVGTAAERERQARILRDLAPLIEQERAIEALCYTIVVSPERRAGV